MSNYERDGADGPSARRFLEAAEDIGALSACRLKSIRSGIESGALSSRGPDLARLLIRQGIMSEFQARYLLHGRASNLLVGRYVISGRIGNGSMGRVYLASDPLLGRDVALKLIDARRCGGPGVVARFRREMRMAGRLDHPHIVRAYDAGRVGDRLYIAMELIAGASLEEHLRHRGPLPPGEVARHAARAAQGLAHAHARGVVHRDVKPANLLVDARGAVKLLDFGLGVLAERDDPDGFATDAAFVVGTANFISPEQACGRPVDGRSDLYSLGCTMYYLITGALPFAGDSQMERIAARLVGKAIPIGDLRPGLPPGLAEAIGRLMARRPEDRFPDAATAAATLGRLARPAAAPRVMDQPEAPEPVGETTTSREPRLSRLLGAFLTGRGHGAKSPVGARAAV